MKSLYLSFLGLLLLACNPPVKPITKAIPSFILEKNINKYKADIDAYVKKNKDKILVLAKVNGKKQLIYIKNQQWPDSIEYSYNVVKDSTGKIVMILQSPYSESGDWDITYRHYFYSNGKTCAFERFTGFFNSECTIGEEAARETITKYYNPDFKVIKQDYKLVDSKNKPLNKSKCVFNYDFEYKIYKNVDECLKAYNIKL